MFALKKVLVSDEIDEKCLQILQNSGIVATKKVGLTVNELLQEIQSYDGLIVRSATKVTQAVIEAGSNLKVIGRAGTGVDNIDVKAATAHGVLVMNTPGGNTISAVEHTCSMMLALTRHLHHADASMRNGKWERKKFMGSELFGKTLAVIGLGRIGREVATRMQSFGMRTIGFDPIIGAEESKKFNVEWYSLDGLWPLADFITVHVPLIPQTSNLICKESLSKCKDGVVIVNVARGGIVSESDLLQGLQSGKVGGAALDVFESEPPQNMDLLCHASVITTPHLGASTREAQKRVAVEMAEQFVELSEGKGITGAVNGRGLPLNVDQYSWSKLARRLAQLSDNSKDFHVCLSKKLQSSGQAMLSSTLRGLIPGNINEISAPSKAAAHGFKVELAPAAEPWEFCLQAADKHWMVGGNLDSCGRPLVTVYCTKVLTQPIELEGCMFIGDPKTVDLSQALAFSVTSDPAVAVIRLHKPLQSIPTGAIQVTFE